MRNMEKMWKSLDLLQLGAVVPMKLRAGSFQIVNQPHSPPIMCTSVSRTERPAP